MTPVARPSPKSKHLADLHRKLEDARRDFHSATTHARADNAKAEIRGRLHSLWLAGVSGAVVTLIMWVG